MTDPECSCANHSSNSEALGWVRLPQIVWLKDRTATDYGELIDTPAMRGFCLAELDLVEPVSQEPNHIYRKDFVLRHDERRSVAKTLRSIARAWRELADMAEKKEASL